MLCCNFRELAILDLQNRVPMQVKLAFSQRRKIVWKLLRQRWKSEQLVQAQKELNLDPMVRAQAITFEQFVSLANFLTH